MNVVVGLIITVIAITALITLRVIVDESALQARLKHRLANGTCDDAPCFGGCSSNKSDTATGPETDGKRANRSTPHAS